MFGIGWAPPMTLQHLQRSLKRNERRGHMVSNGGPAKIDLVSNRLFQSRKAPLVLSLRPSAELLVLKMGPVAGALSPRKVPSCKTWTLQHGRALGSRSGAINYRIGALNYRTGAPWVPRVLELQGSLQLRKGPIAYKRPCGMEGFPWFLKWGPLIPEVGPRYYRSEALGAPRALQLKKGSNRVKTGPQHGKVS